MATKTILLDQANTKNFIDYSYKEDNVKNNVVADEEEDNSFTIIEQQFQHTLNNKNNNNKNGDVSLYLLNLWQQYHLSSKNRLQNFPTNITDDMNCNRCDTKIHKTMDCTPNRTMPRHDENNCADDDDVTPIIFTHRRNDDTLTNNWQRSTEKKIVTCDKVNNCVYKRKTEKLWTLSIPIKLKFICSKSMNFMDEFSEYFINSKNKKEFDSDFFMKKLGKCKNNVNNEMKDVSRSRFSNRKTIFWQCCLIFMYIFLLNLSTSTCYAARQEDLSKFIAIQKGEPENLSGK
uniref:CSON005139 protein n=1 Tax=Culicoides sonorensis TaxID=179676 RepID=A0A336LUV3_CULSO